MHTYFYQIAQLLSRGHELVRFGMLVRIEAESEGWSLAIRQRPAIMLRQKHWNVWF